MLTIVGCVTLSACTMADARDINVAKWKLEVDAHRAGDRIPMYMPLEETSESASLIQVARGPRFDNLKSSFKGMASQAVMTEALDPNGLRCLALVKTTEGRVVTLVGGVLEHPEISLLVLRIQIKNTDATPASFRVGDIRLLTPDGGLVPLVAVSKDDSPLIGKLSDKARELSAGVRVAVDPGKTTLVHCCFALFPRSSPLRLCFETAETGFSVENPNAVAVQEAPKEGGMVIGGILAKFSAQKDIHLEPIEASLGSATTIARFVAQRSLSKGEELPSYISTDRKGAWCVEEVEVSERLDGKESKRTFPLNCLDYSVGYVAGRVSILGAIPPMRVTATLGTVELTFTSRFRAEKGDVLGAMVSTDAISVLSVRRMQ